MIKFHSIAIALLILATPAQGQDLTVDEIVQRTNHTSYYQGQDGKARVSMTITDDQGRTREREFTILRSNMDSEDKEQRFYVYFHRPADIREMVFLVWKHVGADDDRWLYLPALVVVKRIAASDERTSFVGSHFYYEDVSGRGLDKDAHELVETTDDYYVLKNTPKDADSVEFDSFTMWIHKATFIPVKVEYEKGGEVYRIVEALKVEEIQGHKTVTKSRMKDLKSGGETILEYSTVQYDNDLPEDVFTERYLRRAPGKYIR